MALVPFPLKKKNLISSPRSPTPALALSCSSLHLVQFSFRDLAGQKDLLFFPCFIPEDFTGYLKHHHNSLVTVLMTQLPTQAPYCLLKFFRAEQLPRAASLVDFFPSRLHCFANNLPAQIHLLSTSPFFPSSSIH